MSNFIDKLVGIKNFEKMALFIIILLFTALFGISLLESQKATRDTKRMADIRLMREALARYYQEKGSFPDSKNETDGWDVSYEVNGETDILNILKQENYISQTGIDPINSGEYYYRYKTYPAGIGDCVKPFYILQIMNFEGTVENHGNGSCGGEYDWVKLAPNGYTMKES